MGRLAGITFSKEEVIEAMQVALQEITETVVSKTDAEGAWEVFCGELAGLSDIVEEDEEEEEDE